MWTEYDTTDTASTVTIFARGTYQRDILAGVENLSGSSLTGTARRYADRYARSRGNLFARLRAAGFSVSERTGTHNKRILVIGH